MNIEKLAMKEAKQVIDEAIGRGCKADGVWVMEQLKKLGWVNKSYKNFSDFSKFSDYFVRCGYSGGYNHSHLVKGFK